MAIGRHFPIRALATSENSKKMDCVDKSIISTAGWKQWMSRRIFLFTAGPWSPSKRHAPILFLMPENGTSR
jgi:hypothetical protein